MKNFSFLFLSVMLILSSCEDQFFKSDQTFKIKDQLAKKGGVKPLNFRTHLTGDEEVPANNTKAQGQAIFKLSSDGTELHYKLIVANIENVLQAHIHIAPAGSNGGVVAWLYPSGPPATLIPGRSNGVLAEGVITAANLVGALAGETELTELIDAFNDARAYVNVHTSQYTGGEIRGQIWGN